MFILTASVGAEIINFKISNPAISSSLKYPVLYIRTCTENAYLIYQRCLRLHPAKQVLCGTIETQFPTFCSSLSVTANPIRSSNICFSSTGTLRSRKIQYQNPGLGTPYPSPGACPKFLACGGWMDTHSTEPVEYPIAY